MTALEIGSISLKQVSISAAVKKPEPLPPDDIPDPESPAFFPDPDDAPFEEPPGQPANAPITQPLFEPKGPYSPREPFIITPAAPSTQPRRG